MFNIKFIVKIMFYIFKLRKSDDEVLRQKVFCLAHLRTLEPVSLQCICWFCNYFRHSCFVGAVGRLEWFCRRTHCRVLYRRDHTTGGDNYRAWISSSTQEKSKKLTRCVWQSFIYKTFITAALGEVILSQHNIKILAIDTSRSYTGKQSHRKRLNN